MSKADWSTNFIAVDWGTTNRRAYLLGADGAIIAQHEDDLGVTSVRQGGFPDAVEAIRTRLGDRPMLLAGMVGSNRGWHEAPYLACPSGVCDLAKQLMWVEPNRVAIVPGLSFVDRQHADVMRGEEVQLFGLAKLDHAFSTSTICHPGTHTKWARLEAGCVTHFHTAMTGEIFALLRKHSVLAPVLREPVTTEGAFQSGVERTFGGAQLTAELFSIRARILLSLMDESDGASFASGLVIGSDVRAAAGFAPDDEAIVLGRPELTRLYAAAMRHCGLAAREIDGAEAFVAGAQAIREIIA